MENEYFIHLFDGSSDQVKELSKLRVISQMNSSHPGDVNFQNFPEGVQDALDKTAVHVSVKLGDQIASATRINFAKRLDEYPMDYRKYFQDFKTLCDETNLALLSRAFVHPSFRGRNLMKQAVLAAFDVIENSDARCIVLCGSEERFQFLTGKGFTVLGESLYRPSFAPEIPNLVFYKKLVAYQ